MPQRLQGHNDPSCLAALGTALIRVWPDWTATFSAVECAKVWLSRPAADSWFGTDGPGARGSKLF